MIQLNLTAEEEKILAEILNADIGSLSSEISNTDSLDYRNALKKRKELLKKVVESLH